MLHISGDGPIFKYPLSLRRLVFHGSFNHHIINLPNNLQLLTITYQFNNYIEKLPPNLKAFSINSPFTGILPILPNSLEQLYLNCSPSNTVILPQKLVKLSLGEHFEQVIPPNQFAPTLRYFDFYNKKVLTSFPPTLTHLAIKMKVNFNKLGPLPPNLTHLMLSTNQELNYGLLPTIPKTVRQIQFFDDEGDVHTIDASNNRYYCMWLATPLLGHLYLFCAILEK